MTMVYPGGSVLSDIGATDGVTLTGSRKRVKQLSGAVNEALDYEEECDTGRQEEGSCKVDTSHYLGQSDDEQVAGGVSCWGARHTLGLLGFLGSSVLYLTRVSLSITIVSMVGTAPNNNHTNNLTDVCQSRYNYSNDDVLEGDFDWDGKTQGLVLGAFFYGYSTSNLLGGRVAEFLGGRIVFGLGVVISSFLSLLSPLCVSISKELFITLRVLEGVAQGVTFPSLHFMMSGWIPPKDKAKFCSFVLSGMHFGTIISLLVGGWLSNMEFLGGWPLVFYLFGTVGVIWGIPWFLFAHNLPEDHPRISPSELKYILTNRSFVKRNKAMAIPWRALATSVPFWTLMLTCYGYDFQYHTLLTELPTFFSNILHFNVSRSGLMLAVPYTLQCLMGLGWGAIVDTLITKNKITVEMARKISTGLALYIPAVALIIMCWINCDADVAFVLMSLAVSANGPSSSGFMITEQDIAPNLAGSLKGITNTLSAATGFLAPGVTGVIINGKQTLHAWRTVFIITAVTNVICATVFTLFGTAKVQPWNELKDKEVLPSFQGWTSADMKIR
ncbi:sialin-like isoform X3 [Panulirus ornatus]|uniref:sialin-like isoform X3 n=1 Tax=Panulirus ornatus TaxID=150431 RepID=UPI003A884A7D